jgi:ubiquinol-cytochrome c reductase cytochrome b subunit
MIFTVIAAFWAAGERASWSPDFGAKPLSAGIVQQMQGPVARGAELFYTKGCEFCHQVAGEGGERGPDLTYVASRMTGQEIGLRITNGGPNMPAYASILTPDELQALIAFLSTRK